MKCKKSHQRRFSNLIFTFYWVRKETLYFLLMHEKVLFLTLFLTIDRPPPTASLFKKIEYNHVWLKKRKIIRILYLFLIWNFAFFVTKHNQKFTNLYGKSYDLYELLVYMGICNHKKDKNCLEYEIKSEFF